MRYIGRLYIYCLSMNLSDMIWDLVDDEMKNELNKN